MTQGFDVPFENLHKTHKNCTPDQIMLYQIAFKLYKLINEQDNVLSFEHVTVIDQIFFTCRQISFQIIRNFRTKIGMNTMANKLYSLSNIPKTRISSLLIVMPPKFKKEYPPWKCMVTPLYPGELKV